MFDKGALSFLHCADIPWIPNEIKSSLAVLLDVIVISTPTSNPSWAIGV